MIKNDFFVAKEGIPFILICFGLESISLLIGWKFLICFVGLITLFVIWFFRNPNRVMPLTNNAVISPADGKIIKIEKIYEERFLKDHCIKISIFMSVFNVHINRIPYSGKVEKISYNKGKFVSANMDKASLENEQNAIIINSHENKKILFIQIAGLIARRIVCWIKEGELVQKGERFGLIRFGSRVDAFLPVSIELNVKEGDHVKGGETIIGVLK